MFGIGILEFVKIESLTYTVDFGIGSALSKGPGPAFCEGPDPGPGPGLLYNICRLNFFNNINMWNSEAVVHGCS